MTMNGENMSVLGRVMCDGSKVCVPGRVHRLDEDLEFCVCKACGNGWIRELSAFDKLNEALQRFNFQSQKLVAATKRLQSSLQSLNDALSKKDD